MQELIISNFANLNMSLVIIYLIQLYEILHDTYLHNIITTKLWQISFHHHPAKK